ncbi:MAG: hypothetical protein R3357_05750 [Burkholderiales bacterium]|nr:hypothetical protein [Burkholderiales bacterium]
MNDDFRHVSIEDILRDHDLIERATREARRYRAREMRRMLAAPWRALLRRVRSARTVQRTAPCA